LPGFIGLQAAPQAQPQRVTVFLARFSSVAGIYWVARLVSDPLSHIFGCFSPVAGIYWVASSGIAKLGSYTVASFSPVAGIYWVASCSHLGSCSAYGGREVSVPLPGFIGLQGIKLSAKREFLISFSPVAGIYWVASSVMQSRWRR
jgi:hypothetical protein